MDEPIEINGTPYLTFRQLVKRAGARRAEINELRERGDMPGVSITLGRQGFYKLSAVRTLALKVKELRHREEQEAEEPEVEDVMIADGGNFHRLSTWRERLSRVPVTFEVAQFLKASGIGLTHARAGLRVLSKAGLIEKVGNDRYRKVTEEPRQVSSAPAKAPAAQDDQLMLRVSDLVAQNTELVSLLKRLVVILEDSYEQRTESVGSAGEASPAACGASADREGADGF